MAYRDDGIRGLAKENLEVGGVVEEGIPLGYVAVQQEGRPALPGQLAHLVLELRPLLECEPFEGHPRPAPGLAATSS